MNLEKLAKDDDTNRIVHDATIFKVDSTGQVFYHLLEEKDLGKTWFHSVIYNDDESIITCGYKNFYYGIDKVWIKKFFIEQ